MYKLSKRLIDKYQVKAIESLKYIISVDILVIYRRSEKLHPGWLGRGWGSSLVPAFFKKGFIFPLKYLGSGHLNALIGANALMKMDIGVAKAEKGEIMDVRSL